MKKLFFLVPFFFSLSLSAAEISKPALNAADYAQKKYLKPAIETLGMLVSFPTVHEEEKKNRDLPAVKAMSSYLEQKAKELGFEFKNFGDVVVISMGNQKDRLGLITHGDVQPADAAKWKKSPFELDTKTEPGKLIGRGSEDDKGSIALGLYAMKAIQDQKISLKRKVELMVSYTEESDWDPFQKFLEQNPPPDLNVGFDADYPVVVAQKGWCMVKLNFDSALPSPLPTVPYIESIRGGAFMSQVPEDAFAVIENATDLLAKDLESLAKGYSKVKFTFDRKGSSLQIQAKGLAAHSSTPQNGVNAITHLAELLSLRKWPNTPATQAVTYIHEMIGTGYLGEKFGKIAYKDDFMGPLTFSLSMVTEKNGKLSVAANLRRPIGKEKLIFEKEIRDAIEEWKEKHTESKNAALEVSINDPHYQKDAPHVPDLLNIFGHFSGIKNPHPISVGGGTHARLVPHGVDFGPAMPNVTYTGHSEHEFVTKKQFELNLKMYTAMIAVIGNR